MFWLSMLAPLSVDCSIAYRREMRSGLRDLSGSRDFRRLQSSCFEVRLSYFSRMVSLLLVVLDFEPMPSCDRSDTLMCVYLPGTP